jgi:hypothetical protein
MTPPERDALRLRAEQADEVFSGRTVGELILDARNAHADASVGLLGAGLDAILAQCIAEPFEPRPGSLVAALVAPEQLAEPRVPPAVMELQKEVPCLDNVNRKKTSGTFHASSVGEPSPARRTVEDSTPRTFDWGEHLLVQSG